MIGLTRTQRTLVLFFSASAYIAWFSGLGERIEAQGVTRSPAPSLTVAPRNAPPRVNAIIRRDPFAGAPVRVEDDRRSSQGPRAARVPTHDPGSALVNAPGVSAAGGGVPDVGGTASVPNPASDPRGAAVGASLTLVVRATITGANPVAYVANGTMMDIVRVGDRLGDRRIAKIDLRGLAFSDGSRLDLPGNFDATPAPRVASNVVTLKIDDLRKLILGTRSLSPLAPPAAPPAQTLATSTPAPTGTFPSPGPLPTVNQRGIPVGTNPTFDPHAPTPYPEPYPYAPPARRR